MIDRKYILSVPVFFFNQSIRELLQYLLETGAKNAHILICDDKKRPKGVVHSESLYREISFGLHFEYLLDAICDTNIEVIPEETSFIHPDILATKTVVVTDRQGHCVGIADTIGLLRDAAVNATCFDCTDTQHLLTGFDQGVIIADEYGQIESMNKAAKAMLARFGVHSVHHIKDLSFKFDDSETVRYVTIHVQNTYLKLKSYPYRTESRIPKIAIFMTDISDSVGLKHSLSKAKTGIQELRKIIDHCYDEIYVTDRQGTCILVNKACERIYGLQCEDMIGKTSAQMKELGFISSNLSEKVVRSKKQLLEMQSTKIGQKILVIGTPVFGKDGEVEKVVINSREMANMIDVRISVDNLQQGNCPNIVDRIVDLTLKSKKVVAESEAMRKVIKQATQISRTDANVLLLGETGTGKDIIATLIHEISNRRDQTLHRLNCAAFSEQQLEAELFGYTRMLSSPSKLQDCKKGLCTLADKSTLFLDEIDEMPLSLQGKLLHVIEDKNYIPLGSSTPVTSDFRIVAASSKDIAALVREGKFRKDLYYRLNIMSILIPPLRERRADIPMLIQDILHSINQATGSPKSITPDLIEYFKHCHWDGNIRELKNILERLCILCDGPVISRQELPLIPEFVANQPTLSNDYRAKIGVEDLPTIVDSFERALFIEAAKKCHSTYAMADYLKISQATVVRKLKKYDITL